MVHNADYVVNFVESIKFMHMKKLIQISLFDEKTQVLLVVISDFPNGKNSIKFKCSLSSVLDVIRCNLDDRSFSSGDKL